MTRAEFETIDNWSDLRDYAWEVDYYTIGDIKNEDDLSDYIDEEINEWDGSWQDLRSYLNNVPDYYGWFRLDDWGEWVDVGDSFDDYKDEFLEWLLREGYFEDEPEESDEEPEPIEERWEIDLDFDDFLTIEPAKIIVVDTTEEDDDEAEALLQMLALGV